MRYLLVPTDSIGKFKYKQVPYWYEWGIFQNLTDSIGMCEEAFGTWLTGKVFVRYLLLPDWHYTYVSDSIGMCKVQAGNWLTL